MIDLRYDNKTRSAVIKAYENGISYADITRLYGVSHQTIKNWIRKNGKVLNRRGYDWKAIKKAL